MLFVVLKTARYVEAEEAVEFGEIQLFVGADFVITVRHGETAPRTTCGCAWRSGRISSRCGPGAALHAIVDRVVDDYAPVVAGDRPRHPRGRGGGLLRVTHQPGGAHLQAQARGARAPRGASGRCSSRSTSLPAGATRSCTRTSAPTSGTSTTTCSGSSTRSRASVTCSRASSTPNLTQVERPPERGHAEDLGLGGDHRRARRRSPGIYGMNFEHMPELALALRLPARPRRCRRRLPRAPPHVPAQRLALICSQAGIRISGSLPLGSPPAAGHTPEGRRLRRPPVGAAHRGP